MSGPLGINDWEKYWKANRENIEKLFGPLSERSRRVKALSNRELSSGLYEMILAGEMDDLMIQEAAERLGAAKELTTHKLGEN